MPISRVSWDELEPEFLHEWGWPGGKWEPEHLAILGPTGSGKSFFMTHILDARTSKGGSHATILATKPADKTLTWLTKHGWKLKRDWPPSYGENRVIFWPPSGKLSEGIRKQKKAVYDFLEEQWKPDANTIICFDEIAYVENELGLRPLVTRYWREARALGITIVATTQRPRYVSRYMMSEPSWAVAFGFTDEDDAKRTAEVLGNRREFTDEIMHLEPHEFILVHRRTRQGFISKIPG